MLLLALAAAEEQAAPLVMPNWAFPLTAFIIFLLLGTVAWSFRDVANRHTHKVHASDAHHGASEHAGH